LDSETDLYNLKYTPTLTENRYFFTEDLDAFGVDNTTFYSRDILQPQYALKFTGNSRKHSYGLLVVRDKKTSYNDDDFFNILAFKPIFKNFSSQITLMNRMNKDYHNEVLILKPVYDVSATKSFWCDLRFSTKEIADSDLTTGYHRKIGFDLIEENANLSFSVQQMSEDYSIDMGKIFEDDFYGWNVNGSYEKDIYINPIKKIENQFTLSEEIDNNSSKLLERYFSFVAEFETYWDLSSAIDLSYVKEYFSERYFDKYRLGLRFEWDRLKFFQPKFAVNLMETLIYKLNKVYSGYYYQFGLSGDLGRHISYFLSADNIIYNDIPYDPEIDSNYWILNGDLDLAFTNKISLSSGVGFNNYEYNNYSDHWGIYSNLVWEYRPRSNIFLGYKSSRDKISDDIETNSETLFFKINYSY